MGSYYEKLECLAKSWIIGEVRINSCEELVALCDYYDVTVPKYVKHFIYSDSPDKFCADGADKGISKLLSRLRNKITEREDYRNGEKQY